MTAKVTTKTALITGATGAIGPALAQHLHQNGYRLRVLSRTRPRAGLLPPETDFYQGDITDPATVRRAVQQCDVVFHLAALLHIENPPPSLTAEYQRINQVGTQNVAQHAAEAGVRRMVYFSTVKVYGVRQSIPVTETHTPHPDTPYASSKLDGERAAQTAQNLETVILRLSPVYGPYLKGSWERLARAVASGKFLPIGDLRNVRSLTYVDDVAQAAGLVAEHADAPGQIFNVVGHETVTLQDILTAMYAAVGKTVPMIHIPTPLAMIGALLLEQGTRLIGRRSPLTVESLRQLTEDEVYSGEALRKLGFTPSVTLSEGWKRLSGSSADSS